MKNASVLYGIIFVSFVGGALFLSTIGHERAPFQDSTSSIQHNEKTKNAESINSSSLETHSTSSKSISEFQNSSLEEQNSVSEDTNSTDFFASTIRDGNNQSRLKIQLLNANNDAQTVTTSAIHKQSISLLNYGFKRTKNVYPGVDVVEYVEGGRVDYDFHIAPEGSVEDIEMRYSEISLVNMDSEGNLLITTSDGTTHYVNRPRAWQENDGQRQVLESSYVVNGNIVSIDVPNYRSDITLVID